MKQVSGLSGVMLFFCFHAFAQQGWTDLLDQKLSRWGIYQSYRHTVKYDGTLPKDEKGDTIPAIGLDKNVADVFTVIRENGDLVLKVTGETYGCVFTHQDFENYDLKLKVKWGTKIWEPRIGKLKDAGVLYHSIGPNGADYWRTWMLSQEFQIMQGHMGDYWNIANSAIDIRAFLPEGKMNALADDKRPFLAVGTGTGLDGFCLRSANWESPDNEWTEIELICFGDKSLHIVNGHVVMVLQNSRYVTAEGKTIPLTKGKIQLQSEATELYYKDIRIRQLGSLPGEYAGYFEK